VMQTEEIEKPIIILKRVFGYDKFRPLQEEAIENILNKKDTLLIMPTGGGKSICYQVPALIFDGLTIVISPLISLMKDQVEQLKEFDINAVILNSSISPEEYSNNINQIKNKTARLLYIAPESLLKNNIMAMLSSVKIDCIAIDEAHCISEWGHDFRPEYRQLAEIRPHFPEAVCIALTATATPRVKDDIIKNLKLKDSCVFTGSFDRKNLMLKVIPKEDPVAQVIRVIEKYKEQSGIIYCFSRQQVDNLYAILAGRGYSARPYHAGLSTAEREQNQELFIRDDVQIIVATIAFGMGINKPNVRFVIHFDLPKNIEAYYQEIGRAGRDGLQSYCLLLFSYGDIQKIKYFIKEKNEKEKHLASMHLNAIVHYAETEECRRPVLLNYFGENHTSGNCGMCDNCLRGEKEKIDITISAQKFLSCVKRTDEMFGAVHVIDILRGSKAKKIHKFGHERLSTYGIGADLSQKQWLQIYRQFLHDGLVVQDMEFGSLKLTEKSWEVMRGSVKISGYLDPEESISEKDSGSQSTGIKADLNYDRTLFDILKNKRKLLADNAGVPPYVIFPDRTLIEMAAYFPHSEESLLNMHGIGEVKLVKFGQSFLYEIQKYAGDHQLKEIQKAADVKIKKQPQLRNKKRKFEEIGEQYNNGISVDELITMFSVKQSTLLDNLYKFVQEGNILESGNIINLSKLSTEKQSEVMDAFANNGTELLRTVFDALNGNVDYEELKIVRLYYLFKNNKNESRQNVI
jgi:ATP-dependent DNA helicase RecQ